MNVWWKLSPEEAEELSGFLFERYRTECKKRGGKAGAETALKYYAGLTARMRDATRSGEPGSLHPCPVTFHLDDGQYERLCALRDAMSSESPEFTLETALTIGSKSLIDDRLRRMEWVYRDGADGEGERHG